jgi:GTP-binding protein
LGLNDLLDHVTRNLSPTDGVPESEHIIKVAIIGRPNVGKSTLLNALVGSERAIVSPVAGTTRDAVDETLEADGAKYTFVDTAGIRRKGKTHAMAEKLSVVMARRHIRMANVVLLILDATEGILGLDATIAGYAHEEGRALIIVVNKWDAAPDKNQGRFRQKIRDELKFLEYAPVLFVSAKEGRGIKPLFGLIRKAFDSASKRITTGELNRFVERIHFAQDVKIFYMTQASVRPPTFVVFTDRGANLHFSHERFIVNRLRKEFGFEGTPIELKTRRR